MKKLMRVGLWTAAGLLIASGLSAAPRETTTVKVPFSFLVGTQMLPAGTYKIELSTQAQKGNDPIEVVVLRGIDLQAYASFVSRVVDDEATTPGLTFQRVQGREFLTEVRARGKRLEPAATPDDVRTGNVETQQQLIAEQSFSGR